MILLDTIGELQSVYTLATVCFCRRQHCEAGGHNILEPAAVGACIVTGAHTLQFSRNCQSIRAGGCHQSAAGDA